MNTLYYIIYASIHSRLCCGLTVEHNNAAPLLFSQRKIPRCIHKWIYLVVKYSRLCTEDMENIWKSHSFLK